MTSVRLIQGVLFGFVFTGNDTDAASSGNGPGTVVSTVLLVLAVVLYVTAVRQIVTDEDPDSPPPDLNAAPKRHPNVLLIETDDMRWDDLRWMPNVRRLIRHRGLSFENSFAPDPLCAPSRSSLLTGQYTHNHHVYTHLEPYGFAAFHDRRSIATVLQAAGYRTALVGKYINGYGEQFLRSGKPSLHYVPPGWDQWYAGSDHLWDFDDPNYGGGTYSYNKLVRTSTGESTRSRVATPPTCSPSRRGA